MFYIQHTQCYAGDFILWWRPNGMGYTHMLDEAGVYGQEEADQIVAMRGQERAWPVDDVNAAATRAVSIVRLRPSIP